MGASSGSTGGAPLWRKTPFVLARYPGLFGSIAFGALLLAVATAAYPLFLSASASRLLRSGIHDPLVTPSGAGFIYRNGTMPMPKPGETGSTVDRAGAAVAELSHDPSLGAVEPSMLGPVIQVARADRPRVARSVRLFAGPAAIANVNVVGGTATDAVGVWVPDDVAHNLHISSGDEVVVTSQSGQHEREPVAGVFESLYKQANLDGFWHPWYDDLVLYCGLCAPPPQPLIVPNDDVRAIADTLRIGHAAFAWIAPVSGTLTLEDARRVSAEGLEASDRIFKGSSSISQLLGACYARNFCNEKNGPRFTNQMHEVLQGVERRITTIDAPGRLIRGAGLLVALVVVAGAGAFSMAARRVEASLLYARGIEPRTIAVRSALEAIGPCAIGAIGGLALSLGAVGWLERGGAVAGDARTAAIRGAVVAAAAAVALIGIVSAASFLRHSEHHRTRLAFLAGIPWEIGLAALSLVILERIRSGGAFTIDPSTNLRRPSGLLLLFPVLFLAGFATLVARAFGAALGRWRTRSGRLRPPLFLAVHRLAAAPRLTLLLIGASGLCLGLFVQSQILVRSLRATVDAKARVFVGSDLQARIEFDNTVPDRFPMPFTRVTRRLQAGTMEPGGGDYDLLAIDPSTFAPAAYWNPAFGDTSLDDLVGRLERRPDGIVPILLVGDTSEDPTRLEIDQIEVPVRVVGRASSFPGVSTLHPLVVLDETALLAAAGDAPNPLDEVGASTQLWIRGDPIRSEAALARALPYQPGLEITAREVEDIPYISATIDSFEVMNGLGLAAALLVLVAMLMYLQARQRSQIVSYGLSLRMGMRPAGHLAALVAELTAMLGTALVAGVVLAFVAIRLVLPDLDPLPDIPPAPLQLVPVLLIALAAPIAFVVAAGGAWITDLRARRSDLGQVMRVAE